MRYTNTEKSSSIFNVRYLLFGQERQELRFFGLSPKPTAVAWLGFTVVGLFYQTISQKQMQLGSPHLTYKSSTMRPGKPFILVSKGHRITSVLVFRQNALQCCRCCCVRKLRLISPAVALRRTNNASDTGFSLRHIPACRWTHGFPRRGSCTLVSAGCL